jgi:hypothetical protein
MLELQRVRTGQAKVPSSALPAGSDRVPSCPPVAADPATGEQSSDVIGGTFSYRDDSPGAQTPQGALDEFRRAENERQRAFDEDARAHGQPRPQPARRDQVRYERATATDDGRHVRFIGKDGGGGAALVIVEVSNVGTADAPRWLAEGYLVCADYLNKGGEL